MKLKKSELEAVVICPKCKVDMTRKEVEVPGPNVFIDFCPNCKSYWFDKGELSKIVKDRLVKKYLTESKGMDKWTRFSCPRCNGKMTMKFVYNLEVDECKDCNGLWLDKGELSALKEKYQDRLKENPFLAILDKL